jgi:rhodanese-related sulfurtransferase
MIKKPAEIVQEAKSVVSGVSAEAAREQRDATPHTLVIDVREPSEVAASAVPGALNIPRGVLEMQVGQVVPEHDAPVLVCCASGGRAALAARSLQDMGYTNVKVIDCSHQEIVEAFGS